MENGEGARNVLSIFCHKHLQHIYYHQEVVVNHIKIPATKLMVISKCNFAVRILYGLPKGKNQSFYSSSIKSG